MEDPSLKRTNNLLERLVRSAEQGQLGLQSDPPGRTVLYANRVKAPDGCVWYEWDPAAEEPVPVTERYVRGRLSDVVVYEKESPEGQTTKMRVTLGCGRATYEIETTLTATSGRMLCGGLLAAGEDAMSAPITIGAQEADKDQVLFMNVYTDAEGQIYPDSAPSGEEEALSALRTVRGWLGLEADPRTDRFDRTPHNAPQGASQGSKGGAPGQPPPRGQTAQERQEAKDKRQQPHPKAQKKIDHWDDTLGDIDDRDELAEGISAIADIVRGWTPHEREIQAAEEMLDKHRDRLETEPAGGPEETFEPNDSLPF